MTEPSEQAFDFAILGTPVSQQTRRRKRRNRWIDEIRATAGARWLAGEPWTEPVRVVITHYVKEVVLDLDNLPKPILDALKGLVLSDDGQIEELIVRRRQLRSASDPSPALAAALVSGDEFVHVEVSVLTTGEDDL